MTDKEIQSIIELDENDENRTFGQRVADRVASFGGQLDIYIVVFIFLLAWIVTNAYFLLNKGFDPYPFILLNLILSCVAALQAPIIMMSQNRQEEKDRERAKKDCQINLKAEQEIRILQKKLDHILEHQHNELLKIQNEQIKLLHDIKVSLKKED